MPCRAATGRVLDQQRGQHPSADIGIADQPSDVYFRRLELAGAPYQRLPAKDL
jgi:hypothetical protein